MWSVEVRSNGDEACELPKDMRDGLDGAEESRVEVIAIGRCAVVDEEVGAWMLAHVLRLGRLEGFSQRYRRRVVFVASDKGS